jgi:predicted dinucleotide-binding enzyme
MAMIVGIIGAGPVGQAIARKFARIGTSVILANSREPETLQGVIDEIGGLTLAGTVHDAAYADLVILALPWSAVPGLADNIGEKLAGRILIDATNPFIDGVPVRLEGPSSSIVAGLFSDAIVVKAFNHLNASWLSDESESDGLQRIAFIAGDDESANATAADIIDSMGYKVIDVGDLAQGGTLLEPGGSLCGIDLWSSKS